MRNIVKNINNYNNIDNISLIELEKLNNEITENKYNNFLNCLNICLKENIISKEEEYNALKILLGININCLAAYYYNDQTISALGMLYHKLKQLSDTNNFKSNITKIFLDKSDEYDACTFKTFMVIMKISRNIFNILKHSSKSNDNIGKYYFKLLKNNYIKNKNQKYLSEVEINTNEIQPTNNMLILYDCIKACYIKAATKSLETDRKKCNNYNTYENCQLVIS